jgi:hypothetical protein
LVKTQFIVRLARGVFVRFNVNNPVFTAWQVAKKKAESFGRIMARHGADIAHDLGLIAGDNNKPTYLITGGTSSFQFQDTVISLKGACPRKVCSEDSLARQAIRALWYLGRTHCTHQAASTAVHEFKRTDRQELKQLRAFMPSWMTSYFRLC